MNLTTKLYREIAPRWVPFLVVFFIAVLISYAVLYIVDFIPEPLSEETLAAREAQNTIAANRDSFLSGVINKINGGLRPKVNDSETEEAVGAMRVVIPETATSTTVEPTDPLPVSITIPALDRTVVVHNPTSSSVAVLDEALLSGVVRHPDSADFSEEGNIFILGHSSYLPNVFNKSFQAFNGIQELTWGDTIEVSSSDTVYTYQVERVTKAKASEVVVPFTPGEARLTLATCNSFATKDDRFIVEAKLIATKSL